MDWENISHDYNRPDKYFDDRTLIMARRFVKLDFLLKKLNGWIKTY